MTTISGGSSCLLIGGATLELNPAVSLLHRANFRWTRYSAAKDFSTARFGHTIVTSYDQKTMYLFGGVMTHMRAQSYKRMCENILHVCDVTKMTWSDIPASGEIVQPRRNHACALVGTHLVIFGGLTEKSVYLGDLLALDLETERWERVIEDVEGVSCHTAVSVYSDEAWTSGKLNLHTLPRTKPATVSTNHIAEPGIYFFGGMTNEGLPTNKLRLLKTGVHPP